MSFKNILEKIRDGLLLGLWNIGMLLLYVLGSGEVQCEDEVESSEYTKIKYDEYKVKLKNQNGNIEEVNLFCCNNANNISYLRLFNDGYIEVSLNSSGEIISRRNVVILDAPISETFTNQYSIWEYRGHVFCGESINKRKLLGEIYRVPKPGLYVSKLHGKPLLITEVEKLP